MSGIHTLFMASVAVWKVKLRVNPLIPGSIEINMQDKSIENAQSGSNTGVRFRISIAIKHGVVIKSHP